MKKETLHENGCVLAEKNWDVKSRILHVSDTTVLMQGKKNSYAVRIHKDLLPYMSHCEESDYGFIKFRNDDAWIVGFQKLKRRFIAMKVQEKYPNAEAYDDHGDLDIIEYWQRFKKVEEEYPHYEVGA